MSNTSNDSQEIVFKHSMYGDNGIDVDSMELSQDEFFELFGDKVEQ